jgi:integrase
MAIERRQRANGVVYRVSWRDDGGRQRSRTFTRKRDADAFDAKVKLAKRQGEVAQLDAGRQTLRSFVGQWKQLYAADHLTPKTRAQYEHLLDAYVLPELGDARLRAITTERIQALGASLLKRGIGSETIRKSLAMLQGILERAVEWGRIPRNPARSVKKPPMTRQRMIRPLAPADVERIRRAMLDRKRYRDATLISVLAYAGLRPGEALGLRWTDIGSKVIHVERAIVDGSEAPTKTRRVRSVRLLKPLADDLADWRKRSSGEANAYVFPTQAGTAWRDSDFRNWRRRHFTPAVTSAGLPKETRPYDLRHSFASLLLAEQTNPIEVAGQMGHSPATLFSTYAHVIEELRGRRTTRAETVIAKTRRPGVAQKLPKTKIVVNKGDRTASKNALLQEVS